MRNKNNCRILKILLIFLILFNLICNNVFAEENAPSSPQEVSQEDSENELQTDQNDNEETEKIVQDDKSIPGIIRRAVAKWYYIMRLIVIAFMLILLIFIGIKMAISTIASEKAIYKQMLVDWVAGMIIVFSIHYIMIFILTLNDSIVDSLRPLAKEQSDIQQEYEYGDEANKKTSDEIETTLYETARTRAYDLKLTNGFTGMIIYGVLVYFAWRFAFMYFRRVINIIILTLLAPAVSASYAFNKVLTGKSKIFSTWLSEFIMNVIIQIVHVIIYVAFVSIALQLSLVSLPGVILAFVLLSFMLKADKLLRKLFKLSGGKGSLAGNMADKSKLSDIRDELKGVGNAMMGGKLTKMAAGATYRLATKPVRVAGEAALASVMKKRVNSEKYQEEKKKEKEQKQEEVLAIFDKFQNGEMGTEESVKLEAEIENLLEKQKELEEERVDAWNNDDEDALNKVTKALKENEEQLEENEQKLREEVLKYYISTGQDITIKQALKQGLKSLVDPDKYLEKDKDGEYHRRKTRREGGVDSAFWRKKKDGIGKRFVESARWDNLLGISADEKKILKQDMKFWESTILGVVTGIAGFPALVVNPILGMGLLGQSMVSKVDYATRVRRLKNRPAYKNSASYKMKGFSSATQVAINKEVMDQIRHAESKLTKNNMKRHKKLAKKIIDSTVVIAKPIHLAGLTVSGVCLGMKLNTGIKEDVVEKISKNGVPTRLVNVTVFEEDKLDGLYQKKLRDDFKELKKQLIYADTKELVDEYKETFEKYTQEEKKMAESNTLNDLIVKEKLAEDNTIVIGNNIVEIKDNDEISDFVKKANEIDFKDGISRDEKIEQIKQEMNKCETKLIENSITKLCVSKGVADISNLKLTGSDNIEIKKDIIGTLEEKGIIKKGEINVDEEIITNEKIKDVFHKLSEKKDETNEKIENQIVKDAFLECMARENIIDVKKLKEDDTKQKIYDIIKERLMSKTSKSSADVINKLSGEDKLKDEIKLSDNVMQSVEETSKNVKVTNKVQLVIESKTRDKEKLVERETNRNVNETKNKLEKAVYTGDDEDLDDEEQLKMLFLLSEIGKQNVRAEKAGEKVSNKRKEKISDELKYYQIKDGTKQFNSDRDGSKKYNQKNDGNKDLTQNLKNLETRVHGPVGDVIDLINRK